MTWEQPELCSCDIPDLPEKLSDLVELALADLEKCEADPHYEVQMNRWHEPCAYDHNLCIVCLAGSVIAQHGKYPLGMGLHACHFIPKVEKALIAISDIAFGCVEEAILGYYGDDKSTEAYLVHRQVFDGMEDVVSYKRDSEKFKTYLRWLIQSLRNHNL